MVRQKDALWKYVDELKGRFRCKFCNEEYGGGISRVKYHLACKKGNDVGICINVPDDVQLEALHALSKDGKKAKTGESSTRSDVDSFSPQDSRRNLQSVDVMFKQKDKDGVDDDFADCFIINNMAFNIIQTPAFITMMRSAIYFGPSYSIPSYSTLRTKLKDRARKRVEQYVSSVKESWSESGCTLMSDMWTDMKDRSFINVIAYSPKGAVFLNSFECSDSSKTGLFLRDILEPVIETIGPNKIVQLISDNASNYGVAITLILEKFPHIHRIRCAAHGMQLLLKDIDAQVPWIKEVFQNAKVIVDFMYKHGTILALMREHTDNKELRKPCKTRFASNFLMLQSIVQVEDKLRLMVASVEWRSSRHCKSELGLKATHIIQNVFFWLNGKEALLVLEPLIIVLRLVDGEGATNPFLYEAMERARNTIMDRCNQEPSKYKQLLQLFDFRKETNIIHHVHVVAAFLNPYLLYERKISYFQTDVQKALIHIIKTMISQEDKREFGKEIQAYYEKDENLFNELSCSMIDCHPRVWWTMHGSSVPLLQKIAIRISSQPCSSSSCERNWSAFEAAQTKKKNKLSPAMLEDLVYIRINSLMKTKSKEIEKFNKESIKLDKLIELPIDEDDGVEGEEDARIEDDGEWIERELGLQSGFGSEDMATPSFVGSLSQLRYINTPSCIDGSETQAPLDGNS